MDTDRPSPDEQHGSTPNAGSPRAAHLTGRGPWTAIGRVLSSAGKHGITGRAAEAAFFAALALLPAVLTLVAVLRFGRPAFGGDAARRVSADLARLLRVVLTDRGGAAADSADSLLRTTGGSLLGIGTLVAIFVLSRCVRSVQRALAVIAGAPARSPSQEWWRAVLLACLILVAAGVLLAWFTLGPLLGFSQQLASGRSASSLHAAWTWARWPFGVLVVLAMAMVLLAQEAPKSKRRWRAEWPGAVFTVLGWATATALLPIYVSVAARFSPTLGSLGGGLILLSWLYLMMLSLFLGAEINSARRSSRPPRRQAPGKRLRGAS